MGFGLHGLTKTSVESLVVVQAASGSTAWIVMSASGD